jgi:hypothetical protein
MLVVRVSQAESATVRAGTVTADSQARWLLLAIAGRPWPGMRDDAGTTARDNERLQLAPGCMGLYSLCSNSRLQVESVIARLCR